MKDTFKLSSKMYQMKVSQETVSLLSHGSRNEPKERGGGELGLQNYINIS